MLKQIQDIFDELHDDLDLVQLCDNTAQEAERAWDEIAAFVELYKKRAEKACAPLIEHSPDEPPDTDRIVLTLMCYDGKMSWRLNSHHLVHDEKFWMFYSWDVVAWRELPPVPEVLK